MKMATNVPSAKVMAATVAAFLAPLLLAILKARWPGLPLPLAANEELQVIIMGLVMGVITFAAAYLKRPAARDRVVPDPS